MSATTAAPPLGTPIVQPIHHSAAYAFDTLADARAVFAQRAGGYTYARTGNPNVAALEAEIARREGGAGAVAASSGQAAVALALLTLTGPARDAHAVVSSRLYGGSVDLLTDTLADTGLEVSFADPRDPREWEDAVREGTRVFFLESIANPLTELPELEAIAQIAHRHGAAVVVDNTVATPHLYTPGEHGADFVVHSATKYLAGHGGPLGGLLVATGLSCSLLTPSLIREAGFEVLRGSCSSGRVGGGVDHGFGRFQLLLLRKAAAAQRDGQDEVSGGEGRTHARCPIFNALAGHAPV